MQNTKKKLVQATGNTAQLQQNFNDALQDLETFVGSDKAIEVYEDFLTSWISSNYCDLDQKNRSTNYYINRKLLNLLNASSNTSANIDLFDNLITECSLKYFRKRLNEVYQGFLYSENANDLETRQNGTTVFDALNRFLKKIYKIDSKFRSQVKIAS